MADVSGFESSLSSMMVSSTLFNDLSIALTVLEFANDLDKSSPDETRPSNSNFFG